MINYNFTSGLQGWAGSAGTWVIASDAGNNVLSGTGDGTDNINANAVVYNNFTNYTYTIPFKHISGSGGVGLDVGFVLRYQDASNMLICFIAESTSHLISIAKLESGVPTFIGTPQNYTGNINDGNWHTIEITDTGTNITLKLNTVTIINTEAYTTTVANGYKGVIANKDLNYYFDNITIASNTALPTLFDFTSGATEWKINGGTWQIMGGEYSGIGDGTDQLNNSSVVTNDLTTYTMTIPFKYMAGTPTGSMDVGAILRWDDDSECLVAVLVPNNPGPLITLVKVENNTPTFVDNQAYTGNINDGNFHNLEITDTGTNITVKLDTTTVINNVAYTSTNTTANKGIIANNDLHYHFDNITIAEASAWEHAIADFNDDGVVNIIDFSLWRTKYGKQLGDPGWESIYDLNMDNVVNIIDFSMWKTHYGQVQQP